MLPIGRFTNNEKAFVPWKSLTEDNTEYVTEDCLPDDITICEPSKLQLKAVTSLWAHWRHRQNSGMRGLEFKYARPQDVRESKDTKGKGKAKVNSLNPSGRVPAVEDSVGSAHQSPEPDFHENSPAAHKQRKKDRIAFMKTLCLHPQYVDLLRRIEHIKVSCSPLHI